MERVFAVSSSIVHRLKATRVQGKTYVGNRKIHRSPKLALADGTGSQFLSPDLRRREKRIGRVVAVCSLTLSGKTKATDDLHGLSAGRDRVRKRCRRGLFSRSKRLEPPFSAGCLHSVGSPPPQQCFPIAFGRKYPGQCRPESGRRLSGRWKMHADVRRDQYIFRHIWRDADWTTRHGRSGRRRQNGVGRE